MKAKSSGESWQSRARLPGSAKTQWLTPSRTSGEKGGEAHNTCEEHTDTWKAGAAGWLVHTFESNKDCGLKNYRTRNRAMVDQPAKVSQMIWIMEPSWIQTISVTKCSWTSSSVTTQSWSQLPNHSWQGHWQCYGWRHSQDLWVP